MLRWRLDPDRHGSAGFTSVSRLVGGVLFVGFLVLGAQIGVQAWYNGRILPGVTVAGRNIGGKSLADARLAVQDLVAGYRVKLQVADLKYNLAPSQVGVTFDPETTVESAYQSGRKAWLPPAHHEPLKLAYALDRSQLNAFASSVEAKVGVQPIDAGVVVKGANVETVPDKNGWSVDRMGIERLIEADVRSPGGTAIVLKPHALAAEIQVAALTPTVSEAKRFMATSVVLTYGEKTFSPDAPEIGKWLRFEKQPDGLGAKLATKVDTSRIKEYIQNVANELDVAPVNKKVTVENGVSKVETEGVDGMAIDRDVMTNVISDAVANQKSLTYSITSHPVPFKTVTTTLVSLDYGSYIEINLSKQHLWVWQDHTVIYESPVTSGATGAGLGTVTGLFSIYYKTTNTHLVGYQYGWNYDVPVKYWMPFYKGYGLHDAVWRHGNFGGSDYYYGGSHGCVNLPDASAEFIYNWSTIGTPVWIHN